MCVCVCVCVVCLMAQKSSRILKTNTKHVEDQREYEMFHNFSKSIGSKILYSTTHKESTYNLQIPTDEAVQNR